MDIGSIDLNKNNLREDLDQARLEWRIKIHVVNPNKIHNDDDCCCYYYSSSYYFVVIP